MVGWRMGTAGRKGSPSRRAAAGGSVARSFREATVPELAKLGFVEGRNLVIDARLAPSDKMPVVAAELVRSNPDAILAVGGEAIAASIAASDTIPVVMYSADALLRDPDLPLSRSRGNATGFAILGPELDIKRLEILREAVPMAARIGVLVQPSTPNNEGQMRDLAAAARDQRFEPIFIQAAGSGDHPAAFAAFRAAGVAALLIASHPQFNTDAGELAAMSVAAGLPTMCHWPEMAASGCLLAYGPSRVALFRRSAEYIARILAGTSPGTFRSSGRRRSSSATICAHREPSVCNSPRPSRPRRRGGRMRRRRSSRYSYRCWTGDFTCGRRDA